MNATFEIINTHNLLPDSNVAGFKAEAAHNSRTVEEELIERSLIGRDELYTAICDALGYLYVKTHFGVKLDSEHIKKFRAAELSSQGFVPVKINETPYIVVADADMPDRDKKIISTLGDNPKWALCAPSVMNSLQNKFVVPLEMDELSDADNSDTPDPSSNIQELARTGQKIPDMLAMIIQSAISARASDIQIVPTQKQIEIYFKIDGIKTPSGMNLDKNILNNLVMVIIKDASMREITIKEPAVGKAQYKVNGANISVRVNMLKTPLGTDINLRILDNAVPPLDNLHLTQTTLDAYRLGFKQSKGLVLVTGPTGSGKSTTLYSGLIDSDVRRRTIMSVEDPIEYVVSGITQVEVNDVEGNTFSAVTKAFLRHNPNVIVVGEIRDLEVANEACRAAATGHVVLSTLHTNDAVSAISRLLNLGLPGYTISESLVMVVAQRLIRRVCADCAVDYTVTAEDAEMIAAGLTVGSVIKKSAGCDNCRDSGFHGRIAISELVIMDNHIRELLEQIPIMPTAIRKYVREELKVSTLRDDAILKVQTGLTTFEEIAFMFDEII